MVLDWLRPTWGNPSLQTLYDPFKVPQLLPVCEVASKSLEPGVCSWKQDAGIPEAPEDFRISLPVDYSSGSDENPTRDVSVTLFRSF